MTSIEAQRGETLCKVRLKSRWADDLARLNGCMYGHEIAKYTVSACPELEPGRRYGANVAHSFHCMMSIVFTLLPDGTVRTLEPGFDSCLM